MAGPCIPSAIRPLAVLTRSRGRPTTPRPPAACGSPCSCFSARFSAKAARRSPFCSRCRCYQGRPGPACLLSRDERARPQWSPEWGYFAGLGSALDPSWGLPVSFPPARANRANLASRLGATVRCFSKGTSDEMGRNLFGFVRHGRLERLLATVLRLQLRPAGLFAGAGLSATALLPAESLLHDLLEPSH